MADVGGPISYYWRSISNVDFGVGTFMGYWHILAIFSILSAIFLIFLSYLVLRAGPKKAKNRFMALMLFTEALRCSTAMLFWVYAWPESFLKVLEPARVVYYTMSFQLFLLYMIAATFYSEKQWAKRVSEFFRIHGIYLLPIFCFGFILFASELLGGRTVAIGDISWVYCQDAGVGYGTTASGEPLPFEVSCTSRYAELYPMTMSNVALGPLTRILLFVPLIGAIVAMISVGRSQKRIKESGNSSLIGEVRAVRLGFIGKTVLQISSTLVLFTIVGILGQSPSIETSPFNEAIDVPTLLIALGPLIPTTVVLAALFEGLIFTYAVIKNDMFGIDEKLRTTFITATFAGFGAFLLLMSTEAMESIFNRGWIGGVIIGLPLIVFRKPIFTTLSKFSTSIMPESHTGEELGYLEMYSLAMKDGNITENERRMLDLQARTYRIEEERRTYLEKWFDENHVDYEKSSMDLADKYGVSGVNLMSVFSTTGDAPIDEREISESFTKMDQNNDNVISREEFSQSEEVAKLPEDSQDELFHEIDLNKDGVLQYDEFRTIAQITEAQILSQQEQE
ncbi:MAG: EF-hand domain-containing protein [Candidatus Thalassarchaeaceae archaeon]